ncbi:hypothetical protein VCHA53O466_50037 [Vibrio chagasii]|nr:hypothetical protein VCHA53O466_50037 [Vibrio chagasii]
MSFNFRIIKDRNSTHGTLVAIHSVYYGKDGKIDGWSGKPEILSDDSEIQLAKNLFVVQQALLRPVLEIAKDEHGAEILIEAAKQPNVMEMPQGEHWQKVVIYRKADNGEIIDHRRPTDMPFWVKIRDYSEPIAVFKATAGVRKPFYYVARGDGLIVATYTDAQITKEEPLNASF